VNEEEFHNLVDLYYDRLFRAARFMGGDERVAEDLVQDTFLAAADARDRFQARSSDYTWLYGILLNKFRRWLRRKSLSFLSLDSLGKGGDSSGAELIKSKSRGPAEEIIRREDIQRVRRAMERLSADHRAVVALRYVEALSYQEIADALGCPLGTVKSRIHYALQEVAAYLEKDE